MYKRLFSIIILKILLILIILFSCPIGDKSSSSGDDNGFSSISSSSSSSSSSSTVTIEVEYTKGSADNLNTRPIIYVIWIENQGENYIQNLYVCNRVLDIGGGLAANALPYWFENKYPYSDINGVTGATVKNQDFTVTGILGDNGIRQFTIFMEVDHSFDENDWYVNQPALLYSTDIDLDNIQSEYIFQPVGWTRNNGTGNSSNEFKTETGYTSPPVGELQSEMRYIRKTFVALKLKI